MCRNISKFCSNNKKVWESQYLLFICTSSCLPWPFENENYKCRIKLINFVLNLKYSLSEQRHLTTVPLERNSAVKWGLPVVGKERLSLTNEAIQYCVYQTQYFNTNIIYLYWHNNHRNIGICYLQVRNLLGQNNILWYLIDCLVLNN